MHRHRCRIAISLTAIVAVLLTGCSAFTPPIEKPIIEDRSHASPAGAKVTVFSTTAARRSVLVHFPQNSATGRICAEAPPDTADALISSLTFAAEMKGKSSKAEVEATAELSRALTSTVNALLDRSQGLQLFRDGAFHLCLAWQNGTLSDADYGTQYIALLDKTSSLISEELKLMEARRASESAQAAAADRSASEAAAVRAEAAATKAEATKASVNVKPDETPVAADGN